MFILRFGDRSIAANKIRTQDFVLEHHDCLSQMQYLDSRLMFPDPRWQSVYLGAGEEKAVFCICDHLDRVFAVELIDERHYLNGRFVGGTYFFNKRINSLSNVKANPESEFGLTFTGLVKVREFVYGYEWSRFQFDLRQKMAIDHLLTTTLQSLLIAGYNSYAAHYKDVHARNILFEIRSFNQSGVPMLIRDMVGRLRFVKVGLQPVDVR
jgi:hypothetical protein